MITNALVCFWITLQRCFLVVVVCLIGAFALAINDQGQDLILSLGEGEFDSYFWKLQCALIGWSITNWYNSRVLLTLSDFSFYKDQGIVGWIRWTPRVLGILPFIIVGWGVWSLRKHMESAWIAFLLMLLAEAIFMILVFFFRRAVATRLNVKVSASPYQAEGTSWQSLMSLGSFKAFFCLLGFIYASAFILFLLPVDWRIAKWFMPGTIVLIGLMVFTTVLSVLSYFNHWTKRPLFVLAITWIAFWGCFNDNSRIRTAPKHTSYVRPSINRQLGSWIDKRIPTDTTKIKPIPIILIATQGGGIRAMYWTNMLLAHLDSVYAGFMDHTFAISGVSGGGVGASFYLAYHKDFISKGKANPSTLKAISADDYLSAVTAAYLFGDNLQKILPVAVPFFNRTRWLEDAWADSYFRNTEMKTMDDPFLSLWDQDNTTIPSLFLNGTLAETGQKTIVSNLDLDKHFMDVIDVEDSLGANDVPLKTAASLCSRFPIITSGGLLKSKVGPVGHIVDGGYAENTGIETILSVYASMRAQIRKHNRNHPQYPLRPIILFIKNSREKMDHHVITTLPDVMTPLSAFIKAWDRRAPVGNYLASDLLNDPVQDSLYFDIELNRYPKADVNLPLGWFLSESARRTIDAKVNGIENEPADKAFLKVLKQLLKDQ